MDLEYYHKKLDNIFENKKQQLDSYYERIDDIFENKKKELMQIFLLKTKNKKMNTNDIDKVGYSVSSTLYKIEAARKQKEHIEKI